MLDVREVMRRAASSRVDDFDRAVAEASPINPRKLDDGLVVAGRHPLTIRFEGIDDPEHADLRGAWHKFFADLFAALDADTGTGAWGDAGLVTRTLDDARLRFTWGASRILVAGRDVVDVYGLVDEPGLRGALGTLRGARRVNVHALAPGFDATAALCAAPWPALEVLVWAAPLSDADRARWQATAPRLAELRALPELRAASDARRAERARAAPQRTDLAGVPLATMGRDVDLSGKSVATRDLRRLPTTVRVLALRSCGLSSEGDARAIAVLGLERVDVSGNRFQAAAAMLLPTDAVIGVQEVAFDRVDLDDDDFRRAWPEKAFDIWRRWLARVHAAVQSVLDARRHPEAAAWRAIAVKIGPDVPGEDAWQECEAKIRAWVTAAKRVAKPHAKAAGELQPMFALLYDVVQAIRRHPDVSYRGLGVSAKAVAWFVGASRVTNASRFGWVYDGEAANAVEAESHILE